MRNTRTHFVRATLNNELPEPTLKTSFKYTTTTKALLVFRSILQCGTNLTAKNIRVWGYLQVPHLSWEGVHIHDVNNHSIMSAEPEVCIQPTGSWAGRKGPHNNTILSPRNSHRKSTNTKGHTMTSHRDHRRTRSAIDSVLANKQRT